MKAKLLNKAEIAAAFGRNLKTIDSWIQKGMPVKRKGGPGRPWGFDLDACRRWHDDNFLKGNETEADSETMSYSKARALKEHWKAKEAALEYGRKAGELVLAEDVLKTWQRMLSNFKIKLEALPRSIAPLMVGVTAPAAEMIIGNKVHDLLAELSSGEKKRRRK